ncbi:hypothetical protein N2152v2_003547 [Parachlorella kessleri]
MAMAPSDSTPARVRPRTEAWPEDIVQHIHALGLNKGALELKDRLRGLAVCRSWLKALSNLPIRTVYLSQRDVAVCHWIIKSQPSIVELHLCQGLNLVRAVQILHTVQRKDLQLLAWKEPYGGFVQQGLPVPSIFPNLRHLCVEDAVTSSNWVAGLGAMKSLEWLQLTIQSKERLADTAVMQLPRLTRLTRLSLDVQPGAVVQLHLDKLPALSWLAMYGREGEAALLTDEPALHLHHLDCGDFGLLSADFGALPGLKSMVLGGRMELDQPGSIAGATALTFLELQSRGRENAPDPVAQELLSSLPPSVSCLELTGTWTPQAAALGLALASKLEALQAIKHSVSVDELDLITSLPALEKLIILALASNDNGAAGRRIVQRALPHVLILDCPKSADSQTFFKWALK